MGEVDIKGGVATSIGRSVAKSEKNLAFAVARWINRVIGKEFDSIRGAGDTVEGASDGCHSTAAAHRRQHGIVLQIVRTRVCVARVVRRNAEDILDAAEKVNSQTCIGKDRVAENRIVDAAHDPTTRTRHNSHPI